MSHTHSTPVITRLGTVDSTLTVLAAQAEQDTDLPGLYTVVATHQSAGRGRSGRTWVNTDGDALLLATLVRLPDNHLSWVTPLAGVALALALEDAGFSPHLKWPNDVLLGTSKVAGILCEHLRHDEGVHQVAVGVGVNICDVPAEAGPAATTLGARTEEADELREQILGGFLAHLGTLIDEGEPATWRAAYSQRLIGTDTPTTVHLPGGALLTITPIGVDEDGALLARTEDGLTRTITVGDVDLPHSTRSTKNTQDDTPTQTPNPSNEGRRS